jgi:circadian clock protein KaiB
MSEQPEKGAGSQGEERYVLRLFVSGATLRSTNAIANIKAICETELAGRYELEVIDIYQQPDLAKDAEIVAVPTLVRTLPAPIRRLIGDLSETEKVLVGLDLRPRKRNTR